MLASCFGRFERALASGIVVGIVLAACTTDYQKGVDDPNFGGPSALAGQEPPGPSISSSDTGDAGGSSPFCVKAGGTIVKSDTCAVSFAKDVLGAFGRSTPNCSQANCHGGSTPQNQPPIDTNDATSTWTRFTQFQLDDKFYVNPCSNDPKASGILCNLYSADTSGACGVHMPQSGQLAADDLAKVEAWLKCGAPNN